jgi:Capsule assembly protein Wzi
MTILELIWPTSRRLPIFSLSIFVLLFFAVGAGLAHGVTPYLPLNTSPEIERQIERVLILAGRPVIRRPIAAAAVLDALPKACKVDAQLCARVREYLDRYMRDAGVTQLQAQFAFDTGDSDMTLPNAHGMKVDSPWQLGVQGHYQFNDYILASVGGVGYQGRATPTGTLLSVGVDWAQLDVGYRDHWLSPLTDSSMLISTQSPTMPSATLSNYVPIGPLGINYEVFLAQMSKQDGIKFFGATTSGHPRAAGLQLGIEPVSGYSLAVNRVMQYGGGARSGGGLLQLKDALFKNSNRPDVTGQTEEFGNQVASITSSILFPGKTPFAVHVEYAGEDNAYAGSYRLGDTDLSIGIDFPKLWNRYDLSYEISEWQTAWYTHHIYPDGLINYGHVLGHWFGDQRQFGDALGGRSQMLRAGWLRDDGDYLQVTYRNLQNDVKWVWSGQEPVASYKSLNEVSVGYSTMWCNHTVEAELHFGRDVFGDSFARIAGSIDLVHSTQTASSANNAADEPSSATELFVDLGGHRSVLRKILSDQIPNFSLSPEYNYHLGLGARRRISYRGDLGARLELDRVDSHELLSLRALDYRYRLNNKLAATAFFGVGRYEVGLPAYGYYWGGGLQLMRVFRNWDIGLDQRHHEKLGRDKVLASDPPPTPLRTRIFFDMNGTTLYLSRRF